MLQAVLRLSFCRDGFGSGWVEGTDIKSGKESMVPHELISAMLDSRVILFSDWHGTVEFPDFVRQAMLAVADHGASPVLLHLELSESKQQLFDNYLRSGNEGLFQDQELLRSQETGQWNPAIARLVSESFGRPDRIIGIHLFDGHTHRSGSERDRMMADRIVSRITAASKDTIHVVFTGELHAQTRPADAQARWMGQRLAAVLSGVISVELCHEGGEFWGMIVSREGGPFRIGRHRCRASRIEPHQPKTLRRSGPDENFTFAYNVGPITASFFPGAIEREEEGAWPKE